LRKSSKQENDRLYVLNSMSDFFLVADMNMGGGAG
jgi:hypothetical protein